MEGVSDVENVGKYEGVKEGVDVLGITVGEVD